MSKIMTMQVWSNVIYDLVRGGRKLDDLYLDMYVNVYIAHGVLTMRPVLKLSLMDGWKDEAQLDRVRVAVERSGLCVWSKDAILTIRLDLDPWAERASIEALVIKAVNSIGLDLTNRFSPDEDIGHQRTTLNRFILGAAHLIMLAKNAGDGEVSDVFRRSHRYEVLYNLPLVGSTSDTNTVMHLSDWCRFRPNDCKVILTTLAKVEKVVGSWEVKTP